MLPPEVLKVAPKEMAALFAPLTIKASLNLLMPIQWQGADGVLIPKSQSGSLSDISNRREILLAELPAKSMTARLR